MALSLKIENATSLPDGGPLSIDVPGKRGLDIGRDQHLDWTLPDPTRFISGKHCEIRFRDGAYWLHDVSTNGTFVNGAEERVRSPHRLRDGDRLEIGDFIVAVRVDLERDDPKPVAVAPKPSSYDDLWHVDDSVAPALKVEPVRAPRRDDPAPLDFLDHLVDTAGRANDAFWNESGHPPRPVPPNPTPGGFDLDWEGLANRPRQPAPPLPVADALPEPFPVGRPSPLPQPAPAPIPAAPPPPTAAAANDFVRLVARGAGVSDTAFAGYDAETLAEELGTLLRLTTANLKQLLAARSELKDMVRSASHTVVISAGNNPIKFSPSVEDAIGLMFAPRTASYLDARQTLEQSFNDIKQHQVQTYSAMQSAVAMLARDLDPKADRDGDRRRPWPRRDGQFAEGQVLGRLCRAMARRRVPPRGRPARRLSRLLRLLLRPDRPLIHAILPCSWETRKSPTRSMDAARAAGSCFLRSLLAFRPWSMARSRFISRVPVLPQPTGARDVVVQ